MNFFILVLTLAVLLVVATAGAVNNFPIIGVMTQPTTSTDGDCKGNCLYLAASYVKYIESAGARVVPINYYASKSELDNLFDSVNGFLFVGGGASFPTSAQYIYDKTIAANEAGDFSPLWGTCMGFQWLTLAATKNTIQLDPTDGTQMDAENYSIPLDFRMDALPHSQLFGAAPQNIIDILTNENVTMNNHHYGLWTEHFESTPALMSQFNILSTNKDRTGKEFVSTIENPKFPVFGSQWHPEKNTFEWQMDADGTPFEAIDHNWDAIQIAQYTANFFVQQSRKSNHKFQDTSTETASLIYNYRPWGTPGDFVQKYFFANDFVSFKTA
jgi:gamma-glutamyl hydrolase